MDDTHVTAQEDGYCVDRQKISFETCQIRPWCVCWTSDNEVLVSLLSGAHHLIPLATFPI